MRERERLRRQTYNTPAAIAISLDRNAREANVGNAEGRGDRQQYLENDHRQRSSERIKRRMDTVVADTALLHQAANHGCVIRTAIDEIAHGTQALRSSIRSEKPSTPARSRLNNTACNKPASRPTIQKGAVSDRMNVARISVALVAIAPSVKLCIHSANAARSGELQEGKIAVPMMWCWCLPTACAWRRAC